MSRKVLLSLLQTIEVALVGLFLVQALRRLPGLLFNHAAAASLVGAMEAEGAGIPAENVNAGQFGAGVAFLALMLLLPLLAHRFAPQSPGAATVRQFSGAGARGAGPGR